MAGGIDIISITSHAHFTRNSRYRNTSAGPRESKVELICAAKPDLINRANKLIKSKDQRNVHSIIRVQLAQRQQAPTERARGVGKGSADRVGH